ncbi:RagB/SusD family nutrient uptake outer membrane protein [Chryseobacterium sp.]|uniref:RagB/SusD family nutrient uptake outer membrane protein n=1 Tax=Chryseobacterium sp. TaxID=1871047 RepID=UPI00289C6A1C|nr:RagB/SusD family nutrient uptake outer membrane protein [Chryseobacterium sp.]
MKNIFKLSILSLGLLASTGCNRDLLDTYAPGVIYEQDALRSSADLQLLLNSAISTIGSRSESEAVSIFTDEVGIGFANGGQGIDDDYVFFLNTGSDFPTSIWVETYAGISRLNRIIDAADKIVPTNAADAKLIQNIKAQALTLRAYGHLRILGYFSTDPTNDSALAGIIANQIYVYDVNDFPRNTNGQFYTFIHKDLNDAISLFQSAGIAANINYGNINFARGLKARAFAYKGDYTNAEIWANQVINTAGLALANKATYKNIFWSDAGAPEVLFRIQRTGQQNSQDTNLHNAWFSVRPSASGSPFFEVSRALHNKLNPTNLPAGNLANTVDDARANLIIGPDSVIDPGYSFAPDYRNSDRLIINKHGGRATTSSNTWANTSNNANNNSFKIMRLSEMYMIVAEARAQASDFVGVATAIKTVRDARFGSSVTVASPANQTAAWKMILDERRIEFAFEGYRFMDIKRLGSKANSGLDRDPADYSSLTSNFPAANPVNMPLTSYKWTLPIPNAEINVNTEIVQNPGY